jgi:hypothetical protein
MDPTPSRARVIWLRLGRADALRLPLALGARGWMRGASVGLAMERVLIDPRGAVCLRGRENRADLEP